MAHVTWTFCFKSFCYRFVVFEIVILLQDLKFQKVQTIIPRRLSLNVGMNGLGSYIVFGFLKIMPQGITAKHLHNSLNCRKDNVSDVF